MRIIAGTFKNRVLASPKGLAVRPTSGKLREALFNICQHYIQDSQWLDLFAGSGAMGLEALSRGAKRVTFVDSSRDSIRSLQTNVRTLGVENQAEVLFGDVFAVVKKLMEQGRTFDIIYSDPPYDTITHRKGASMTYSERLLRMLDEGNLLSPNGVLFLEDAEDSLLKTEGLKSLVLRSQRRMGRAALHQFTQGGL